MTFALRSTIKNIALLDDEPGVLLGLRLLLQALGFKAYPFSNAPELFAFLGTGEGKSVQLLLCDLRMPEWDGFQVLAEMRAKFPAVNYVLVSGHATKEDVQYAACNGSVGFLGKPFFPQDLEKLFVEQGWVLA